MARSALRLVVGLKSLKSKDRSLRKTGTILPPSGACAQAAVFKIRSSVPLSTGDDGFRSAAVSSDNKKIFFVSSSGSVSLYNVVRTSAVSVALKADLPYAGLSAAGMAWLCEAAGTVHAMDFASAAVRSAIKVSSFRASAGFTPAELDGLRGMDFLFVDPFNRIFAASGQDGSALWNFGDAPDTVHHAPIVFARPDRMPCAVFAAQDGTVTALDGRNGWAVWKNPLQSPVRLPLAAMDAFGDSAKEIFVLSPARRIFCLTADGRTAWRADLPAEPAGEIVVADLNKDGSKEIALSLTDGSVVCLCPTGAPLWTLSSGTPLLPGGLVSMLLPKKRAVLVLADANGFLKLIDGATGSLLGGSELPSMPVSPLIVRGSRLVFSGQDGKAYEMEIRCP